MNERQRILFLICIMAGVAIAVSGITIGTLYDAAIEQQRERLVETAQSQARLLEAVGRFNQHHFETEHGLDDTLDITLSQMREAYERFKGFGETGEFTLAKLEEGQIIFLLRHRHYDLDNPEPVPFSSTNLAEPMRRALSGESGTIIGPDYRGETVLAAFEPISEYDGLGIVAKIDLVEVQKPFIKAGLLAGGIGLVVISFAVALFWYVSNPLLRYLEESEQKYRTLFESANDSIFIIDPPTRRILDVNTNAAQRLGYTKGELLQLTLDDLYGVTDAADNQAIIQEMQEHSSIVFEHTQRRKDGSMMPVEVSNQIIEYGNQRILQNIVRDITGRKQVEEKLQESEARYRQMFMNNQAIKLLIDPETGAIVQVNPAAIEFYGYPENILTTMHITDINMLSDAEVHAEMQRAKAEKRIFFQFRHKLASGEIRDVEVYSGPIDIQGERILFSIITDITERKRAEKELRENEKLLRTIAENYPNSYLSIIEEDFSTGFTSGQEFMKRGLDPQQFVGLTLEQLFGDQATIVRQYYEKTFAGEECSFELFVDDQYELYRTVPLRAESGSISRILVVIENITERKQAEEKVQELNQELERRVAERTAQLEAANRELEAFAYSVSHDLRAPLRHIGGYLELLKMRITSELDERGQHYMNTISSSTIRMAALIDDLLSFSRMGRYEVAKNPVELGPLLEEVLQEYEPETQGRVINWHIAELPTVIGDQAMLRVVFVNLITNALKFTQQRQPAKIEVGYLQEEQNEEIVVFVRDNGVGFDMAHADKLFGVFQRLHRIEEFDGNGIGLANVQRIINRHGGRTWAEGKVDQGATFYFSLPPPIQET